MTAIPGQICQAVSYAVLGAGICGAVLLLVASFWKRMRTFITEHWVPFGVWLFVVLYWASGFLYIRAHVYGGSIIGFRALDTPVNHCVAAFYRPWFIIFMGYKFKTEPVEFWNHL
jgi:hypothetical protein